MNTSTEKSSGDSPAPTLSDADQRARAEAWFAELRDRICAAFEAIEADHAGPLADRPAGRFERKSWQREGGGGGTMSVMRGRVFEKVGVNISTVWGSFSEDFRGQIPGTDDDGGFWATGISLVAHMHSPRVPAVHMNTRHIATTKSWFGGGADLNPMVENPDDTAAFHAALKAACDAHDPDYYPRFKAWCDEYFFNKHRGEPRGVGGIFYDYVDTGDWEADFTFTRAVGEAFLDVYPRLVRTHRDEPWTEAERAHQLVRRGHYAEFNLVYDRGTTFGLKTGGNIEAVLMSLPPVATWP
ncbi:MAG: oxygen-dependent coproporphyrinogen oxidase [Azospirillaceae bacterium]